MGLQGKSENCLMCLKRREQKKMQHSGGARTCLLGSNFKIEHLEGFLIGGNTMPLLISQFLQDWSGSVEAFSAFPSFSFFIFFSSKSQQGFLGSPIFPKGGRLENRPCSPPPRLGKNCKGFPHPCPQHLSSSFSGDLVPSTQRTKYTFNLDPLGVCLENIYYCSPSLVSSSFKNLRPTLCDFFFKDHHRVDMIYLDSFA